MASVVSSLCEIFVLYISNCEESQCTSSGMESLCSRMFSFFKWVREFVKVIFEIVYLQYHNISFLDGKLQRLEDTVK